MKVSRRFLLRGIGGTALALPLLESLSPSAVFAQAAPVQSGSSFAIFFRQANGVACDQDSQLGTREPERFWPNAVGALTEGSLSGPEHRHRRVTQRARTSPTATSGDHQRST